MSEQEALLSVGGKQLPLRLGLGADAWDFGWIPPFQRTLENRQGHMLAESLMVPFLIVGDSNNQDKVLLTDFWKHPRVVQTLGREYIGTKQFTGCCVGAGGGNAVFTLAAIEVVKLGDPEEPLVPFWLYPYGRSRFHAGMRGKGEGSLGSAFAKAMIQDGIVPANLQGLPPFKWNDGLEWGSEAEMNWSDGANPPDRSVPEKAKVHVVKSAARIRSAQEMAQAVSNGYPCTWAGDWGGLMQCQVTGNPPVLLNRRRGVWMHQQACLGYWRHPSLGNIYWIQNQWGLRAHGTDPAGGPGGGYWIQEGDADYQCRQGEVYAFSGFSGFPGQPGLVDWLIPGV